MTKPLSVAERQDIQALLEANRDNLIEAYREYAPSKPPALAMFAKDILNCELLLEFNAAAIEKAQKKAVPQQPKKSGQLDDFWTKGTF